MANVRNGALWRRNAAAALAVIGCLVIFSSEVHAAKWWEKAKGMLGGATETSAQLSPTEVGGGLKEALRVGTENVVGRLGQADGFNADPAVHIPLPGTLDRVSTVLTRIGMSDALDDLELRLNRAAELATPIARDLFVQAIQDMTIDDVMGIYKGPQDSATRYFQSRMSDPLQTAMQPVVTASLADVGAAQAYGDIMDRYNAVPFVKPVDADLSTYVVKKGMDGIFFYLAKEEAAIRQDPAKRTTDLLKKVFGASK
jgi:hypothetical protein